ncbi:MAG TPA: hypothetical protein VE282_03760 [Gemmatimonadales bacterium]|jgi:pimeloyl-ACP methyl ester carboxylesterase|nr:hypothetical protein [Gemmatimonadales bacterium]
MPKPLPAGPYEMLDVGLAARVPWYVIPFDKQGTSTAPKTRAHLLATLGVGGFTDVFLFSHGWNNDWSAATDRYRRFIDEFSAVRGKQPALPGAYRPLLIGVFWPSTALVLPWEKPPAMAAAPPGTPAERDAEVGEGLEELNEIAPLIPPAQQDRFYELASAERLSEAEARELAEILAPLYAKGGDPEDGAEVPKPEELLEIWQTLPKSPTPADDEEDGHGFVGGGGGAAAEPAAAGLGFLDPRGAIRAFTVWQMKDRAGVVGTNGVGPLLRDVLAAADGAKIHLIGHSYGAKVVLSALTAQPLLSPNLIESVLLLEPAINGWAFAANVDGQGFAGGYRKTLGAIRQPVYTTFSRHDAPLTKFFHLAVRRDSDLGEVRTAAAAPSRFAALGGFGPQGGSPPEFQEIVMPANGEVYPKFPDTRVVGLAAHDRISGHGEVENPHTAWALFSRVLASRA